MDEQKALSWQALYDNMWGIFALGLLLPIVIYTVWGIVEIINVPQLDVNSAMQALQPAQQAVPAEAALVH
ncbi:MAG: hypothetical protein Q7T53_07045 [Deltaproteobacteria bacterium]|nr:hypothetical protein [Deltaproteobacteria bacterium]